MPRGRPRKIVTEQTTEVIPEKKTRKPRTKKVVDAVVATTPETDAVAAVSPEMNTQNNPFFKWFKAEQKNGVQLDYAKNSTLTSYLIKHAGKHKSSIYQIGGKVQISEGKNRCIYFYTDNITAPSSTKKTISYIPNTMDNDIYRINSNLRDQSFIIRATNAIIFGVGNTLVIDHHGDINWQTPFSYVVGDTQVMSPRDVRLSVIFNRVTSLNSFFETLFYLGLIGITFPGHIIYNALQTGIFQTILDDVSIKIQALEFPIDTSLTDQQVARVISKFQFMLDIIIANDDIQTNIANQITAGKTDAELQQLFDIVDALQTKTPMTNKLLMQNIILNLREITDTFEQFYTALYGIASVQRTVGHATIIGMPKKNTLLVTVDTLIKNDTLSIPNSFHHRSSYVNCTWIVDKRQLVITNLEDPSRYNSSTARLQPRHTDASDIDSYGASMKVTDEHARELMGASPFTFFPLVFKNTASARPIVAPILKEMFSDKQNICFVYNQPKTGAQTTLDIIHVNKKEIDVILSMPQYQNSEFIFIASAHYSDRRRDSSYRSTPLPDGITFSHIVSKCSLGLYKKTNIMTKFEFVNENASTAVPMLSALDVDLPAFSVDEFAQNAFPCLYEAVKNFQFHIKEK